MYIAEIPSRQNGKVYRTFLLRESYREGGKVKTRTIANLSHAKPGEIEAMNYGLKHKHQLPEIQRAVEAAAASAASASASAAARPAVFQGPSVGAVWCVFDVARQAGVEKALGTDHPAKLALWQVLARVLGQGSRLSAARLAASHAAAPALGLEKGFNEDDLYANLDWLAAHQAEIEKRLFEARRGGRKPELFLYDVTSSYLEGTENELAAYGYNRDGKKGKKQIVIGMLCDERGEPVSVEVFRGNTNDVKTFGSQILKLAGRFVCERVTLAGDRGMIKTAGIEQLRAAGFHYITAITKPQIETLLDKEIFQMEMFDEALFEVEDGGSEGDGEGGGEGGGVRYVLRRNPVRAAEMAAAREEKKASVLTAIERQNAYLSEHKKARADTALRRVNALIESLKVGQWLTARAEGRTLAASEDADALAEAARLDGCYVIKSDLAPEAAGAQALHDRYKDLALVEKVFRTCKTAHLEMRPVHVRTEARTRGHLLVVTLAYLVVRRLTEAWETINLTVEEGLRELEKLCAQTAYWPGQKARVNMIPIPNEVQRELLGKANVRLPEALPSGNVTVGTRKQLPERRK